MSGYIFYYFLCQRFLRVSCCVEFWTKQKVLKRYLKSVVCSCLTSVEDAPQVNTKAQKRKNATVSHFIQRSIIYVEHVAIIYCQYKDINRRLSAKI